MDNKKWRSQHRKDRNRVLYTFGDRFNALFLKPDAESNDTLTSQQRSMALWIISAMIAFLVTSLALAMFVDRDYNYFHDGWLVFSMMVGGALFGVVLALILKHLSSDIAAFRYNGGTITAWLFTSMTFSGFGWGAYINSFQTGVEYKEFRISEMWYSKGCHARLEDNTRWVNCTVGSSFYHAHRIGDKISVWVHHGLLGFDYVTL